MKMFAAAVLTPAAALLMLLAAPPPARAGLPEAVLRQKKAVVTIYLKNKDGSVLSSGTGFLADPQGTVVTTYHVISRLLKPDATLTVKLENGTTAPFQGVLDFDEKKDIALLSVAGSRLPFIRPARNHEPKQGDHVVVIGSPLGLETTVSDGIISSVRGKEGLLQITAPVSRGSSGSPVLNADGDVIGVVTSLARDGQNLNFAVPIAALAGLLGREFPGKSRIRPEGAHAAGAVGRGDADLERGDAAFAAGNYRDARKAYTAARFNLARTHRKLPHLLLRLAQCHLETGADMEALQQFIELDALYPASEESRLGKSLVRNRRWFAADHHDRGDFIDATSIVTNGDGTVTASVRRVTAGSSPVILDIVFDCGRKKFQPVKAAEYVDGTEKAVHLVPYPEWFAVSGSEYARSFWNVVCGKE